MNREEEVIRKLKLDMPKQLRRIHHTGRTLRRRHVRSTQPPPRPPTPTLPPMEHTEFSDLLFNGRSSFL
ncbi:12030_t:CDS:2 [Dentiscutata erythropus]|uniref:12030_t:CDS:1 n=1 Tax=Dentiscutata erythropus TaxID=1348616 RepID=A0A9N9E5X3_9GLOM|nr:12030_t:CDS:2 [Dentiscutata erythropus]